MTDLTRHGRYSRSAYGELADLAEDVLIDVSDNGIAMEIDEHLRQTVFQSVRVASARISKEPRQLDASLIAASEHTAKRVLVHQEVIVTRLRELADIVERRKPSFSRMSQGMKNIGLAEDITHDVKWGISNLPLDLLLRAACEADVYAAQAGVR